MGRKQGISDQQLTELANFEQSVSFDEVDKAVLRYVEGMSHTPADVADRVFAELQRHLDTAQIVELTAMIAFENFRARFNRALRIESDGFCALPPDHPVRTAVLPFSSAG